MSNRFLTTKDLASRFSDATLEWMRAHPKETAELMDCIRNGGKVYLSYPTGSPNPPNQDQARSDFAQLREKYAG